METPIQNVIAGLYKPLAYESITVADAAIGFTGTIISPTGTRKPIRAVITVETAQVRYRYDGSNPESGEGHILNANDTLVLLGYSALANFKAIKTGATSGVLKVTYEG